MAAPRFFKQTPIKGRPLALPGLADGLRNMALALETLSVHNGHVDWGGYRPKIIVDRAAGTSIPSYTTDDIGKQLSVVADGSGAKAAWDYNRFMEYSE